MFSILFLALIASSSAAPVPSSPSTPSPVLAYNVALPGPTPAYQRLALPILLPYANVTNLLGAVSGGAFPPSSPSKRQVSASASANTNATTPNTNRASTATGAAVTCLDSTYSELEINTLFANGGAGTIVNLCPGAVISILYPIQLTAARQSLVTLGYPSGSQRATILVNGPTQGNAIITSCGGCDGASLRNIQINGNRPATGYVSELYGNSALIEMGGSTTGQYVDNIKAFEPRTWSAFHAIEGDQLSCRGLVVKNSQFGPSGNAPSTSTSSKKRDAGVIGNEWADGMSIACGASSVFNNIVQDATDGGIVVFQAPNSTFTNNTIISSTRDALGGLNMVDYAPWGGEFTGVVVSKNQFITSGAMMKVAIAAGPMVWGDNNSTQYRTFGGKITGNTFSSLSTSSVGFGYGIAIAGHGKVTIGSDNVFTNALFAGRRGPRCTDVPTPAPGPAYVDRSSSSNVDAPPSFANISIQYLLCLLPNSGSVTHK